MDTESKCPTCEAVGGHRVSCPIIAPAPYDDLDAWVEWVCPCSECNPEKLAPENDSKPFSRGIGTIDPRRFHAVQNAEDALAVERAKPSGTGEV